MGRPRKIHVDPYQLLVNIAGVTAEELAGLRAAAAAVDRESADSSGTLRYGFFKSSCHIGWEIQDINGLGVPYDLVRFAGHDLTPSERIRHQEAIRKLHAEGLVVLNGLRATRVRVTAAGLALIAERAKQEAADA